MGMFSWKCKGCRGELVCPEYVRIDDHVGTYNGYGVVVMVVGSNADGSDQKEWDVYDRDNPCETFTRAPNAWHVSCYLAIAHAEFKELDRAFEDDRPPSERAENQGFGDPQERFLPPKEIQTEKWRIEYAWQIEGADKEEA